MTVVHGAARHANFGELDLTRLIEVRLRRSQTSASSVEPSGRRTESNERRPSTHASTSAPRCAGNRPRRWFPASALTPLGSILGRGAVLILAAAALLSQAVWAAIPQQVSYEGRVTVAGQPFNGSGLFRFTLANRDTSITLWCNDGSRVGQSANTTPTAAVALAVTTGIVSVRLGDTALANMTALPATVFDGDRMVVRVWFDDGSHGNRLLSPDQPITSVGYAFHAAKADTATVALSVVGGGGAGSPWTDVTSTSIHAAANRGYVANNASTVTITLPTSATLSVGDIIAVSGAGTGGWKIAQNTGQKIHVRGYGVLDYSKPWAAGESNRDWRSVASSSDGTKLVACVAGGQIYMSADSGATWTPRESNRDWYCVTSSADGTKLAACVYLGQIYTCDAWQPIPETIEGTAGSLTGAQYDAIELQYIGANEFLAICHNAGNPTMGITASYARTAGMAVSANSANTASMATTATVALTALNANHATTADTATTATYALNSSGWSLTGNSGTTSGTSFLGTTDNRPLDLRVNNTRALRLEPNAAGPSIIAGYADNSITSGVVAGTIAGGGAGVWPWYPNLVSDSYGTVGGGSGNRAGNSNGDVSDARHATVAGGQGNVAISERATVGGGLGNVASGYTATVAGGEFNTAFGSYSSVPGGTSNTAQGMWSFAAGRRAKANHHGAFVWADSTDADIASSGNDQFIVRASGGVGINTNAPGAFVLRVGGTVGVDGALNMAADGTAGEITNLAEPTTSQSAATKNYVDNAVTDVVATTATVALSALDSFKWVRVTATSQQAQANRGYMADNASLVTITLPTSATLAVGDTIRVSGAGLGTWKIAQQAGQKIRVRNLQTADYSGPWTARESNRNWYRVASSADGTKLLTAVMGGQIYTSWDSGATWTPRESDRNWFGVASSADGTKLVATAAGGQIYTSSDSGVTWTARDSTSQSWRSVASAADGSKLVAVVENGQIYTSSDSGVTWTARETSRYWTDVASSADGTKLVACVNGGQIYTSSDSGTSWTARESNRSWYGVASSADGTKLVACVSLGQIYTSSDSGVTWTARESNRAWYGVASSADGTRLVASTEGYQIYTSSDSGLTWTARESSRDWHGVASSADGTKLVVCIRLGQIYTYDAVSRRETTTGTGGYLMGGQEDAVELQYIGANTFVPISWAGTLTAQ